MSILGYSASYFLPEYWSNTPLYGEKILPLIDYILSTDFVQADKLANAFYMIENKYKNTADLPLSAIEAIIEESGYGYVMDLLGEDEDSLRLLVYLLVLIHQLKGTKLGIEVVLNLLKRGSDPLVMGVVGDPNIDERTRIVNGFTTEDYVLYNGFTTDSNPFELTFQIRTSGDFRAEQCIASCGPYGFYLGIDTNGKLVLCLGSKARTSWDIANRAKSAAILTPNTNYLIKLVYDGFDYTIKVSIDEGERYSDYIEVPSNVPTEIHKNVIYLGVDNSTGTVMRPFLGDINLSPFAMDVQNIEITEWFEQYPVGAENTFMIKSDLDLGVVSTDFFQNFAEFVKKYVYPTLGAFEARLVFQNNLTFLPYIRQKIKYVAEGDVRVTDNFLVKTTPQSVTATDPFRVTSNHGLKLDYEVELETFTVIPTPADAKVTLTATGYAQLGNTISISQNTSVSYRVEKEGYVTQTGTRMVGNSEELAVVLAPVN